MQLSRDVLQTKSVGAPLQMRVHTGTVVLGQLVSLERQFDGRTLGRVFSNTTGL
jgi:hypothetical protein